MKPLRLVEPKHSYDEMVVECERLGLIETVEHGGHNYFRFTQTGNDVLWAMVRMASYRTDPANKLEVS